jgi:transposase
VQDKELYQQILGLVSPWTVASVELDHQAQEIRVQVEHPRGAKFRCSECDCECPMTMRTNDVGDIWIPVSSRRS